MKHLLESHGIQVVNNQIAKADVEKAISVIAARKVGKNEFGKNIIINSKYEEKISKLIDKGTNLAFLNSYDRHEFKDSLESNSILFREEKDAKNHIDSTADICIRIKDSSSGDFFLVGKDEEEIIKEINYTIDTFR